MNDRRRRLTAFLLFALTSLLLAPAAGAAPQTSKVMLVLDASGSMLGKVDGKPKIDAARGVIKELLKDWESSIELGLAAYGHRSKGECSDIETLRPVGRVDAASIMKAVNGIKPKGKTPLTEAVRRAAEELRYTEDRATVILVSDGLETCAADPCAVAKTLEETGVDFTVHVVGFDLKEEEKKALQCLADNTGGLFLAAKDAGGLHDALKATVTKVKEQAVKAVEAKPAPKKEPAAAPGHRFVAMLAEGGPEIESGMRWDIYAAEAGADGQRKHLGGTYDAKAGFKLEAGRYLAVAKRGSATASQEFEVKSVDEAARHAVVLDAGIVVVTASLIEGQEPLKEGMRWDVYGSEKDVEGKRKAITGTYDAKPEFTLNSGAYHVVAKTGSAVSEADITIEPGKRIEKPFVLNAGIAAFEATYDQAGQEVKDGMRWDVYALEKDLDGQRKSITGTYDAKPRFVLPAAKYLVIAKRGNAELTREIEITPGKRNEERFVLNAGLVQFSAILTDGKTPLDKGMRWDIYSLDKDLEGKRRHFGGSYDADPLFTFNEGKYLAVAKNGSVVVEKEIEVAAGKRAEPMFNMNAGIVKLIAKASSGSQLSQGLRWDVYGVEKDLEGKRQHFGGSYDAAPIFTLAAGKYAIEVKAGQTPVAYELEVKPGDSKQVDVSMQ